MAKGMDMRITVSFVEDPDSHTVHVWLSVGDRDLGVICEQAPVSGMIFTKLDATEIQEEWFDRLCPVCFKGD